ncbi:DsbA family protein [Granulicatella adiacens]|uniref:DsbA family protein n=1 Tax=Granulicatella adiacens TaxID=46124 RepID=UPI00241DD366|nr:DsbA family protein [Granulicatella adiacens]
MSTYETKNLSKNTSHEKIFELFLFVNPLGTYCYRCENELLKFVRNSEFKVHYHFLTFHNLQTVNQYMKNQKLPVTDLDLRNDIYMKIYDAALSYKAALLQGKRLGHQFLIELQQQIHQQKREYNDDLLEEILNKIEIDKKMFYEDKSSSAVKKAYDRDLQIAQEMNVTHTPSLVIFDNSNQPYGLLLASSITAETISEICNGEPLPGYHSTKKLVGTHTNEPQKFDKVVNMNLNRY